MITYQAAKEAWLREVLSVDLQELPEGFLADLAKTIELVEESIARSGQDEPRRSLMLAEKEKLKAFLTQMMQVRVSKLAAQATEGRVPTGLTAPERKLLQDLRQVIESYEKRFYRPSGELPGATSPVGSIPESAQMPAVRPAETEPVQARDVPREAAKPRRPERNEILRIVREFPSFVARDLKTYGPFAGEDIVALPGEVSEILLGRKVAERVRPAGE